MVEFEESITYSISGQSGGNWPRSWRAEGPRLDKVALESFCQAQKSLWIFVKRPYWDVRYACVSVLRTCGLFATKELMR